MIHFHFLNHNKEFLEVVDNDYRLSFKGLHLAVEIIHGKPWVTPETIIGYAPHIGKLPENDIYLVVLHDLGNPFEY